ncbi:hypothetical protein FACS1894167_05180 [Synergistales bacterium]|nr:hypothetical protein FACS1894167_05180 [Synergistales bacterium]
MYDKDRGFYLKHVVFVATLRCNLRCKLCSMYITQYEKPYHPTTEQLQSETDAFFRFADYVGRFTITGGEVFLLADFDDWLLYLYDNYFDRMNELRIFTNGTIVPNEQIITVAAKFGSKARIIVDNYGSQLSPRAKEAFDALNGAVSCELRDYYENLHCDGWVNLNDFSKKHDKTGADELYAKCSMAKDFICLDYINGKISLCAFARRAVELGVLDAPEEQIDLHDEATSIEEKREVFLEWERKKGFTACMYCDGRHGDSERFMPAEQISESK